MVPDSYPGSSQLDGIPGNREGKQKGQLLLCSLDEEDPINTLFKKSCFFLHLNGQNGVLWPYLTSGKPMKYICWHSAAAK